MGDLYYLGLGFLWLLVMADTLLLTRITSKKRYIITWGLVRVIPLLMVTLYGRIK
jgi:hypothetical protein